MTYYIPMDNGSTKTLHPLQIKLGIPVRGIGRTDQIEERLMRRARDYLTELCREELSGSGLVITTVKVEKQIDPSQDVTIYQFDIEYAEVLEPHLAQQVFIVERTTPSLPAA